MAEPERPPWATRDPYGALIRRLFGLTLRPRPQAPLVVVCHYDARPTEPLVALLRQMREIPAGAAFDTLVAVNSEAGAPLVLPPDLAETPVLQRPNGGYNIGAWEAAWRQDRGHDFYLFLQDECELLRPGWLAAFIERARAPEVGYVGESAFLLVSWAWHRRRWPTIAAEWEKMRAEEGLLGRHPPSHMQMTVIAAYRAALEAIGGLASGDAKARASAGEILTHARAVERGFRVVQLRPRPYSFILHPQWQSYVDETRRLPWALKRLLRAAWEAATREPARLIRLARSRPTQLPVRDRPSA